MKKERGKTRGISSYKARAMRVSIIDGAFSNDINVVRAVLEVDKSCINQVDQIYVVTALHIAVGKGNLSMVDFLISCDGMDLSIKDMHGRDALDMAISVGQRGL